MVAVDLAAIMAVSETTQIDEYILRLSWHFAYDEAGEFAVLQGYAWLWKRKKLQGSPSFDESSLPWGYLAILNSPVFETLLESSCPRVQGGQFNLSTRFVDGVFLPDLADSLRYTGP